MPNASDRISFAHNARTICVAFVAFASRYRQGNITVQDLAPMFNTSLSESVSDALYETFKDLGQLQYFLPPQVFANKDQYDSTLSKLFSIIIEAGITSYSFAHQYDSTLTATNYLKKDKNYYTIISTQWFRTVDDLNRIFAEIGM